MTSTTSERMVLRAELLHDTRHIVAHTTELSPRSVFVRTDERLAIGDVVGLKLSFPRLLAPLELEGQVVATDPGLGHGYAAGVTLALAGTTEAHERLARLLDDLDAIETTASGTFHVLVVEDSVLMRDFIQLGAGRFTRGDVEVVVETVDTAERALELSAQRYDLVLVDLYLPGEMDGAALVRRLRAEQPDLPVIGFSVGGESARTAFLAAGADLFLDKPVMVKDVFSTLERLTLMRARRTA
jgi:CheY-like chemotaxis protein